MSDRKVIREALAKATPGPWRAYVTKYHGQPANRQEVCVGSDVESIARLTGTMGEIATTPEAELIAHAPEWLAALCDECDRLERERDEAVEALRDALPIVGILGDEPFPWGREARVNFQTTAGMTCDAAGWLLRAVAIVSRAAKEPTP